MKDFVREYGKMAGFFAVGAFLLSLVIGLVSRNPFGTALLRALLLAAVFAGLGAGIRFVARTYLAESGPAAGSAKDGDKTGAGDGRGARIDIVLPEERPPARQRARAREGSSLEDSPLGPFPGLGEQETTPGLHVDAAVMDNLAEELEEELPSAVESKGGGEDILVQDLSPGDDELMRSGEGSSSLRGNDSPGSAEAAERDQRAEKGGSRRARRGSDADEDSLPDISNLEILTDRGAGAPGERPGGAGEETPEDAVRGAVGGQDPATLARAIRTVLKRDEKG